MNSARRGLFPKYAAALMIFVGVLAIGGGAIESALLYREVRDAASEVQRVEARAAAERIEQFLSGVQAALAEVSGLPWARGGFEAGDRREEYHRLMKIVPAIAELRWLDRQGRERLKVSRVDADQMESLAQPARRDEFEGALAKGFVIGTPYFRDGSEPFVTVAIRDRSPKDDPSVTLADIDLKFVADVVRQIRLGKQGRVYVVDDAARLLAHPNLDLVLRRTELARFAWWPELHAAAKEGAARGMIQAEGLESGSVMVSGAFIPSAGWVVVAEQPRGEVMAPAYSALARTAGLLLVGLVAALLVSYWLARRLARPILEVRRGAEKIARGDLGARIDVKTGDEIEALATEFNAMAAQLQDYTTGLERKVAEKTAELQAALRVAHDAMRAKAMFLAAASHDLRQPLYAISILADALSLEQLPPATAAVLDKQRQAIAVLRALFDNILDLSRFEAGEIKPVLRNVSVRDVLAPLAGEYETVCAAKGLAWRCEIDEARVRTDPDLLRRLVANLLSNAARYTQSGSVSLVAKAEPGRVLLEIADTGIGIAPEDQARVFEEFVQIGNPSRERDKGVGLGLSIVRKIDALIGTRLSLDSTRGEGTRIALELPLAQPGAAEAAPGGDAAPALQAFDFAGARVWVVEDDRLVRDALAAQFAAWGVDYEFASNRAELEALEREKGGWPEALVLDDMLESGERGLEIARWLAGRMAQDAIVFVTGNVDPARLALLRQGGFRVLRKPVSAGELGEWLRAALRSSPVAAP